MTESPEKLHDDGWFPDDFMELGPRDAGTPDMWTGEPSDFGFPDDIPNGFDEPEPESEFISDLSQSLHTSDIGIANLFLTLELDGFLATVKDMTDLQRNSIEEKIGSFTARKRANWLQWMSRKEWTGKSLLLYLRFYDLWGKTPIWWEYFFFSATSGVLRPYYNPGVLSRDKCYALVHLRLEHRIENIIDESWVEDWEDSTLWGYEFDSFASFAIFRAGIPQGEDWRFYIGLGSRNGHHNQELRDWEIYLEWWDELSEWRDNLI